MSGHTRRDFLQRTGSGLAGIGLASGAVFAPVAAAALDGLGGRFPRPAHDAISLATWSLNRSYAAGLWDLLDIARICREDFNIDGIEYVTHFFRDVRDLMLRQMNQRAADYGVKNVLIMVDREGDMGAKDKKERMQAALNHRKWVEIAAYLECFAIRCNCTGVGDTLEADPDAIERSAESFNALLEYAKEFQVVICIENHGRGLASSGPWLASLAKKLDNPNFGLLPDFGNFGATDAEQTYESLRTMMPYAVDISVKGSWAPDGSHPRFSLDECLRICKEEFGYTGYWGIESGIRRQNGAEFNKTLTPLQIQQEEWTAVRWTANAIRRVILKEA